MDERERGRERCRIKSRLAEGSGTSAGIGPDSGWMTLRPKKKKRDKPLPRPVKGETRPGMGATLDDGGGERPGNAALKLGSLVGLRGVGGWGGLQIAAGWTV